LDYKLQPHKRTSQLITENCVKGPMPHDQQSEHERNKPNQNPSALATPKEGRRKTLTSKLASNLKVALLVLEGFVEAFAANAAR
jgi:hypothetical protein